MKRLVVNWIAGAVLLGIPAAIFGISTDKAPGWVQGAAGALQAILAFGVLATIAASWIGFARHARRAGGGRMGREDERPLNDG